VHNTHCKNGTPVGRGIWEGRRGFRLLSGVCSSRLAKCYCVA
jgi:hypothetical protein